jgi:peptidoglycan lytic transglycosylase
MFLWQFTAATLVTLRVPGNPSSQLTLPSAAGHTGGTLTPRIRLRDCRHFRALAALAVATVFIAGCGGRHATRAQAPAPPPEIRTVTPAPGPAGIPSATVPPSGKVIYSEVGMASWYGPSFNHRRAANGEVYDQDMLTAAHRTIPLNSVARVTNVKTGESVIVRITDRGPFVPNRIIDLSKGAAKRVGVYIHGTALVRVDVLSSPAAITYGGRWAVQIGAFDDPDAAIRMKKKLAERYRSARVLEFAGPRHDWWVRVRVLNDDRERAQDVARNSHTSQGDIYLVRLD